MGDKIGRTLFDYFSGEMNMDLNALFGKEGSGEISSGSDTVEIDGSSTFKNPNSGNPAQALLEALQRDFSLGSGLFSPEAR